MEENQANHIWKEHTWVSALSDANSKVVRSVCGRDVETSESLVTLELRTQRRI